MSADARAIVRSIRDLVDALDALFETRTMNSIIHLVKSLKQPSATKIVEDGLLTIANQLGQIRDWLQKLKGPLTQVGALEGLLALVDPLLRGVGGLLSASARELGKLGIDDVGTLTTPFQRVSTLGSGFLQSGQALLAGLPKAEDVDQLGLAVERLTGTLEQHRNELAKPAKRPGLLEGANG